MPLDTKNDIHNAVCQLLNTLDDLKIAAASDDLITDDDVDDYLLRITKPKERHTTNASGTYPLLSLLEKLNVSKNNHNYDYKHWSIYWQRVPNKSNEWALKRPTT